MDDLFSIRLMERLALKRKMSSFLHNEVGIRSDEARKVLSFSANDSEIDRLVGKLNDYWCRKKQKSGLGNHPEDRKGGLPICSLVSHILASYSSSYEALIDEARNVEKFDFLPIAMMLDPEEFHDSSDLAEALNKLRNEGKAGRVNIIDPVAPGNGFLTGPYPSVSDIKYAGLNTDLISIFDNSILSWLALMDVLFHISIPEFGDLKPVPWFLSLIPLNPDFKAKSSNARLIDMLACVSFRKSRGDWPDKPPRTGEITSHRGFSSAWRRNDKRHVASDESDPNKVISHWREPGRKFSLADFSDLCSALNPEENVASMLPLFYASNIWQEVFFSRERETNLIFRWCLCNRYEYWWKLHLAHSQEEGCEAGEGPLPSCLSRV
ncbi:hypothetical protein [uncultured Alcanivorax sp.]|uniref:hypothetical protein n=1 Tax=uncultured Alcanivorax sp. TaxID=191215 RepID=UPI0026164B6B|nr:hypothetical protein [uncultured Alcanivorax sp.]